MSAVLEISKNFNKEINETIIITLYEEVKEAIKHNWESLYFSENGITFATVQIGNYLFELTSHGEVEVIEIGSKNILTNDDTDCLIKLLDSEEIYNQDKFIIDNNNWFSFDTLTTYDNDSFELIDDEVFESIPATTEELKNEMLLYALNNYNYYINDDKKGTI